MNKQKKNSNRIVKLQFNNYGDDKAKINELIKNRIYRAREIIIDTIISIQLYRKYELFSNSEVNICIMSLKDLHNKTIDILTKISSDSVESIIDLLQSLIDKLTAIISTFGTKSVDDLIYMTFGSTFINYKGEPTIISKFNLIRKYIHPTGFKILSNYSNVGATANNICIDKITDDIIVVESSPQFECFPCDTNTSSFHNKVYGIKVIFRCEETKKIMIMSGITDDVNLDMLADDLYIEKRKNNIMSNSIYCNAEILNNQINAMTLKEILISGDSDIIKKNASIVSLANQMSLNGNTATVQREIEGGEETCEVVLPAIVSCQKGMAEQRIPNMRGIMAARTKPLKVVEPIAVQATTSIKNYDLPPAKSGVKLVAADNVEELVRLLKEEAKAF